MLHNTEFRFFFFFESSYNITINISTSSSSPVILTLTVIKGLPAAPTAAATPPAQSLLPNLTRPQAGGVHGKQVILGRHRKGNFLTVTGQSEDPGLSRRAHEALYKALLLEPDLVQLVALGRVH